MFLSKKKVVVKLFKRKVSNLFKLFKQIYIMFVEIIQLKKPNKKANESQLS